MVHDLEYPFAHTVKIPHDLFIRASEHKDAIACEERIAFLILDMRIRICIVRLAINLDGESHGRAVEVNDRLTNRMLTTKPRATLLLP